MKNKYKEKINYITIFLGRNLQSKVKKKDIFQTRFLTIVILNTLMKR